MEQRYIRHIGYAHERGVCVRERSLWIKSDRIYYVQATMVEFGHSSMLVAWWRRHLMLLECLDAQGTFLQQSTFYSIGFPYGADEERGRERKRGRYGGTERERM